MDDVQRLTSKQPATGGDQSAYLFQLFKCIGNIWVKFVYFSTPPVVFTIVAVPIERARNLQILLWTLLMND